MAEEQNQPRIDHLRRPAEGDIHPQEEDDVGDVGGVDDECRHLQRQCGARVARARHGLEVNVGGHQQQVGGAHHPERVDGRLAQLGNVGVDPQNQFGKQHEEECQRQHEGIRHAHMLSDSAPHALRLPRADEVAHQ